MEIFQMTHNVALLYGGFIKLVKEHIVLFQNRTFCCYIQCKKVTLGVQKMHGICFDVS